MTATEVPPVDVGALPPTQSLIFDVLAARLRLGELRRGRERSPSAVPPDVIRLAEWLAQEEERVAEAMWAHTSGIEP